MDRPLVLIKTGGKPAEDSVTLSAMAREMCKQGELYRFLFVHGGGTAVSAIQKVYGLEPVFSDGIRITSPEEMDLVDMGLAGLMNKKLVRLFCQSGLKAVGLSGADGSLFTGESIDGNCRTGRIVHTDPALLEILIDRNYTPVICSVSADGEGIALNINADEAALALGKACGADSVLFISDIPGILNKGNRLDQLNESQIAELIDEGTINGGMIPKVRSSLAVLKGGVGNVVIGNYEEEGDLIKLLSGEKGTKICLK